MKKNRLFIWIPAVALLLVFSSACKKNNVDENRLSLSKTAVKGIDSDNKLSVTKIAAGINPIDIQFDNAGKLYILTPTSIKVFADGNLSTLSLPDTVFSDFRRYDSDIYGPPKHITADVNGTIYLAQADGIRVVYKDGRVNTFTAGEIGWGVYGLTDIALSKTNELYYINIEGVFKAVSEPIQTADSFTGEGLYPWIDLFRANAIDITCDGTFWLGSFQGIVKVHGEETNRIGEPNGDKNEGPVSKVKFGNVTQLEVSDDASVIYFIDQGYLKQLKKNTVKILTAMPDDTRIALSKDAKKLYYIANNDLNVINL